MFCHDTLGPHDAPVLMIHLDLRNGLWKVNDRFLLTVTKTEKNIKVKEAI